MLAAPPLGTALASRALVDRAARDAGRAIAAGSRALAAARVPPAAAVEPASSLADGEVDTRADAPPSRRTPSGARRAVRVRRDAVLAAIQRGVVPRGEPTDHGVRVTSAPGLTAWIRAGDLVTHVAGRPVRSFGDVIDAVVAAHRAHAKVVTGRLLRKGEPWDVAVETPW